MPERTAKGRFVKGNKEAKGGPRPNSGRPPDEFKRWLKRVVHSPVARKRFEKILNDAMDADEKITEEGVCVPTRAKADTYLRALEMGWNFERGKPVQGIEHSGEIHGPVVFDISIEGIQK